jgi:glutamate-1-semialdehyde 2,1-aminomutase
MNSGSKLYKKAKKIILGGNMLLSKRPEMFLLENWPAYFQKTSGCKVWDLDDNLYLDLSIMGIGTNTLGYNYKFVDDAVKETVSKGNVSTFNCPEEVYLADFLIDLHPWASMVKFARSGGEANAISIRIARAASGKDKVAICGYHGWHDWYLSANIGSKKSLDGHLLPGLEPKGVPRELNGSVLPFKYNDFDGLFQLVQNNDVGVIKMEVERDKPPENDFLLKVRELATKKNIILIFDECTSGFRETFGGLHKKYGVNPDMATFGKALGNGFGITAVIGKEEIMQAAQSSFISSTFWTERIGPTAGLATLKSMKRENSWEKITIQGKKIQKGWRELANKYDLKINIAGLPASTSFSFVNGDNMAYKTLITQEMLKKGYLATNLIFVSLAHTDDVINSYLKNIDPIFKTIKECQDGKNIIELLDHGVCHSGFKRLN